MTGWKWIATGIALALGVAGLWWAIGASQEPDERRLRLAERAQRGAAAAEAATPEDEIAALREALVAEREARLALELELEELRARAEESGARGADALAPQTGAGASDASLEPDRAESHEGGADLALAGGAEPPDVAPEASPSGNRLFDERKLEALGVTPNEAARLRERFEEAQMRELYLRDRAAREGWLWLPRLQMARQRQIRELRKEVGDESYDLMLFASGQPNRVKIAHLLESSPGSAAGLQAGDVVKSYDGQPVFSPFDLQRATRTAKPGTQVAFEVLRGDEGAIRVFLPAGPIGAQLEPFTLPPER